MTPLDLVLQIALGIVSTAALLRWDMRRLPAERYVRAWNTASFWSAVVAFGPLSIPVHFARTRRSFSWFLAGIAAMTAVLFAIGLINDGLDAPLGY